MKQGEAMARFRALHNQSLPVWYRWDLHILINLLLWAVPTLLVASQILTTSSYGLVFFVGSFLGWSVFEYLIHRFLLHGNLHSRLSAEHSLKHHGYFTASEIAADSWIDTNRILLLPVDLGSVICLNAVLSAGVYLIAGNPWAAWFFLAGNAYILVYELSHAICHSPLKIRSRFLKAIVAHHRLHHDPGEMKAKNFSIVFPFIDDLFGTRTRSERHV